MNIQVHKNSTCNNNRIESMKCQDAFIMKLFFGEYRNFEQTPFFTTEYIPRIVSFIT
jgi:hypothetical protein